MEISKNNCLLHYKVINLIVLYLFADLHSYNSFFQITTPTIPPIGIIQGIQATFALAEASTYEEIEAALPTIVKFSKAWSL